MNRAIKRYLLHHAKLPYALRWRWAAELNRDQFKAELERARSAGDLARVRDLTSEQRALEFLDYEEGEIEHTKVLLDKARRLRVQIPPPALPGEENEWWAIASHSFERYLTPAGVDAVRTAIRKETKWTFERNQHFISWIAAATGLVGALIGLVAVLTR